MAEAPEDLYARIIDQVGPGGRLPMTAAVDWDVFPWAVVDGAILPKVLAPPLAEENPRQGDPGGTPCKICAGESAGAIWENDGWTLRPMPRGGLPLILMLEPKEHLDYTDLSDEQAGELGRLSLWLTRIMEHLDHVGRVHVMRIGDGAEHLHVWFIARPARFGQILGSFAVEYDDMLPATPEDSWRADQATVVRRLALHDGRALL